MNHNQHTLYTNATSRLLGKHIRSQIFEIALQWIEKEYTRKAQLKLRANPKFWRFVYTQAEWALLTACYEVHISPKETQISQIETYALDEACNTYLERLKQIITLPEKMHREVTTEKQIKKQVNIQDIHITSLNNTNPGDELLAL